MSWGYPRHGRLGHSFAASISEVGGTCAASPDQAGDNQAAGLSKGTAALTCRTVMMKRSWTGWSGSRRLSLRWKASRSSRSGQPFCVLPTAALRQLCRGQHSRFAFSRCKLLQSHLQSTLPAEQVACGDDHSLALSTDGSLFAFGDNSLGQLGSKRPLGTASSDVLRWLVRNEHHQLLRCRKVRRRHGTSRECDRQGTTAHVHLCVQVAAGLGHNLAVSLDGKVLSWGWNAGSQLGLGPEFARQQVVHFPRQVSLLHCWVTASAVATVLPSRLSTCHVCRYTASQRTQTPSLLLAECTACCSQMSPQALTPRTCLAASHKVSACLPLGCQPG